MTKALIALKALITANAWDVALMINLLLNVLSILPFLKLQAVLVNYFMLLNGTLVERSVTQVKSLVFNSKPITMEPI